VHDREGTCMIVKAHEFDISEGDALLCGAWSSTRAGTRVKACKSPGGPPCRRVATAKLNSRISTRLENHGVNTDEQTVGKTDRTRIKLGRP
jgi:hypothetical protein